VKRWLGVFRRRGGPHRIGLLVLALVTLGVSLCGLGLSGVAAAQSAAEAPDRVVLPDRPDVPPPGYSKTSRQITRIADADRRVRQTRAEHRPAYLRAYVDRPGRWRVSFFVPPESGTRSEEIVRVVVDDRSGRVLEVWTGPQVAWTVARGLSGQFGRAANAAWVWIGLCVLFLAPFARLPLRMVHLDLVVLLGFSISYAFFNDANLDVSVPSAYPLLAYLLARMLWSAFRPESSPPIRLAFSPNALLFGLVFLVGFRVVLNVVNGNVIDVGYAGVIGADRLIHGESLYGGFPADNAHGDTYGPLAYAAYVPFVLLFPWSGSWDDLPAAHAAAVAFDLACLAGLWVAGRRFGGRTLGLLLAYLWAACPFTLLVVNSGANDALVGALALAGLLCLGRPAARGALAVAAGLTKFAPLALVPLYVYSGRRRGVSLAAAGLAAALIMAPVLLDPGLERFWDRTLGFQSERTSPFSIWGLYGGLDWLQAALTLLAAGLAVLVALVPRERDEITVAALAAAVLIALQLTVTHWFYLYLVWFLPLMLVALLARPGVTAAGEAPARSLARIVPARSGSLPR
jgi:hypothetical protein